MKKKIAILGSTGSIGKSTLSIINKNKHDFDVVLLSTNKNLQELKKQYKQFKPSYLIISDNQSYNKSLKLLKKLTKREDLGTKRADIYNLLGFSYRKLENPELDKSFAAYMMAIELDPSHLGAHEYLGELYLMRDQKDKALIILEKLDQLAGSNTEEYRELKIAIDEYQS